MNDNSDEDLSDEFAESEVGDIRPHPNVLQDQGIRPMTYTQLYGAWWNCRPLSLTSLAVDKLIIAAAPHIWTVEISSQ